MVMDMLRSGYVCNMRLWDDPAIITRVRWFRAAKMAKPFPQWHRFASLNWEDPKANTGLGEQYPGSRPWNNGVNSLGYLGQNFCGTVQAFQQGGRAGIDPPLPLDVRGVCADCIMPQLISSGQGIGIGSRTNWSWHVLHALGGVAITGTAVFPAFVPRGGAGLNGAAAFRRGNNLVGTGGVGVDASAPIHPGPFWRPPNGPLRDGVGWNGTATFKAGPFWRPPNGPLRDGVGWNGTATFKAGPFWRPPNGPLRDGNGMNGIAYQAPGARQIATGGVGIDGSARWSNRHQMTATGGVGIDGSARWSNRHQMTATGGVGIDGSAGFHTGNFFQASGGVGLNASAKFSTGNYITGGGGSGLNGIVSSVYGPRLKASGGVHLNASARIAGRGPPIWQTNTPVGVTVGNFSVTKPAGTVAGDLLVMGFATVLNGAIPAPPAGWTVGPSRLFFTNLWLVSTWLKLAGGSEPASYAVTQGPASASNCILARVSPVSVTVEANSVTSGVASPETAATLTTLGQHRLLLGICGHNGAFAVAAGWTQQAVVAGTPGLVMVTHDQVAAGATGTVTIGTGLAVTGYGTVLLAIM
jgi:hypothetical protein